MTVAQDAGWMVKSLLQQALLWLIRECIATVLIRGRKAERKLADSATAVTAWPRASFLCADQAERTQWKTEKCWLHLNSGKQTALHQREASLHHHFLNRNGTSCATYWLPSWAKKAKVLKFHKLWIIICFL